MPSADRNPGISRNVSAYVGERIEIPFDGSGWTYLGEKDGKDGVTYETRRFEGQGVVFVMLASRAGSYALRFQRQDSLRGTTSTEFIGAQVSNRPAVLAPPSGAVPTAGGEIRSPSTGGGTGVTTGGTAVASGGAPGVPSGGASGSAAGSTAGSTSASPAGGAFTSPSGAASSVASGAAPGAAPGAAGSAPGTGATGSPQDAAATAQPSAPPPDPNSPEGMLLAAKNELAAGRVQSALADLDKLLAAYPSGTDEVFFLYGLALEQNGPFKDIRRAYQYYKKVRDDFPESPYWDKANDRISYIERHYFEIR